MWIEYLVLCLTSSNYQFFVGRPFLGILEIDFGLVVGVAVSAGEGGLESTRSPVFIFRVIQ